MDKVRKEAHALRLKGYSYNEINDLLGIPKSTLSGWFKDIALSKDARARLASRANIGTQVLIERNKTQTRDAQKRARDTQEQGRSQILRLSLDELRVVGAALYWAEGYKRLALRDGKERTGHAISFVNSDPEMIAVFIRFLEHSLKVPPKDIYLVMRLYPHIDENKARKHWMRATGLPKDQFKRTTRMVSNASKRRRPLNRLPYGTLQITVNSTRKFHELIGLIEGVKEELLRVKISQPPG